MKLVVLNNPVPGREEAFRSWLDEVHIPELLTVPGVAGATRYEPVTSSGFASMTVYDLDADPQEVLAEMGRRRREGLTTSSDSMDTERVTVTAWRPVTVRRS